MDVRKILVVDDEEDVLTLLESRLTSQGYVVLKATNGLQGLEVARKDKPDLVILDIMMPKMDGMEMSQKMKEDPQLKNIPIIFLTALKTNEDKINEANAGKNIVFAKPFSPQELMSNIEKLLVH